MNTATRSLALLLFLAAPTFAANDEGFVPLFDGKSLDEWVQRGGEAKYHVADGEVVGTSVARTPNTFLCTPREYGDFELTLEVKVDSPLNSGIQIRSECFDEPKKLSAQKPDGSTWQGTVPAGRVHGYQVEIDPSARAWSGGIYDEARRGWLNDLTGEKNEAARKAFKPDEWNTYRIRCQGDHIQTWVNGVPAADLHDSQTASGFIALQVHSVGNDQALVGKQVRWRKLMIREL